MGGGKDKHKFEVNTYADASILRDTNNSLGHDIAKCTRSATDTKIFEEMSHEDFISRAHNSTLLSSRMIDHLNSLLQKVKDVARKEKDTRVKREKELCEAQDLYDSTAENVESLKKQISALQAGDISNTKSLEGKIVALVNINRQVTSERDQLKTSLEEKKISLEEKNSLLVQRDAEIEELKNQLMEKISNSDLVNLTKDQYEIVKDNEHCMLDMGEQIQIGFDKFRRAALRRLKDPIHADVIKKVDLYDAEKEDELEDEESRATDDMVET